MTTVVVVDTPKNAERSLSVEMAVWGDKFNVKRCVFDGNVDQLVSKCCDTDAVLTDFATFTRGVLQKLKTCQIISIAAGGHNAVDIGAAEKYGINVCVVDEYCTDEVADHALALMLALARRLPDYQRLVQEQGEWKFDAVSGLSRLHGRTLGLIGFGRIGRAVAKRAQAFGLKVISHDPMVAREIFVQMEVESCDLDTLFDRAHIVSSHCNLDESNKRMIDRHVFAKMSLKPIMINVARGELIDEDALEEALEMGQIAGAGLDVLSSESPDLSACGLLHRNNVVLTPHVAFYSDASIRECREVSARNILHHLNGDHDRVTRYVVKPHDSPS